MGIPLKSSAAEHNIGFLHGLLDLSHDKSRPVGWTPRIALVGVDSTQRHCFGSFCIHVLTKDGLPNAHATTQLDLLSSLRALLSVSSTPPSTSSTQASCAKQSSCGDGPSENAATSNSSSSPRRSQDTELVPHHWSRARACQNQLHKCVRPISRAHPPSLGDSSTTTLVLS